MARLGNALPASPSAQVPVQLGPLDESAFQERVDRSHRLERLRNTLPAGTSTTLPPAAPVANPLLQAEPRLARNPQNLLLLSLALAAQAVGRHRRGHVAVRHRDIALDLTIQLRQSVPPPSD